MSCRRTDSLKPGGGDHRISDRSMRRWRQRYEEYGYDGLYDRRLKPPSPKEVPLATVERVLRLYREKYFDFNVRHSPDRSCKTQIARALEELDIEPIPANSPQARGRCERFFGTWQGRFKWVASPISGNKHGSATRLADGYCAAVKQRNEGPGSPL